MSHSTPPNLGPIPDHVRLPLHCADDLEYSMQQVAPGRMELAYLHRHATERHTHAPYTWGYTIFCAVPSGPDDARFAAGLARLEAWMAWHVRQERYNLRNYWDAHPEWGPAPGKHDATDDVADRLWNEVFEDPAYVDDFDAVGRAFIKFAEQNRREETPDVFTRYDYCLILDEAALRSLEALPAELPELKTRSFMEANKLWLVLREAWVWVLDRDWMARRERGEKLPLPEWAEPDEEPYPPWARIQVGLLRKAWFDRPRDYALPSIAWQNLLLERDGESGLVLEWCQDPRRRNESRRQGLKRRRAEEESGADGGHEASRTKVDTS